MDGQPWRSPALSPCPQHPSKEPWTWGCPWALGSRGPPLCAGPIRVAGWVLTGEGTRVGKGDWEGIRGRGGGIRRDTYCRTAVAWPRVARAASAPSAGTRTGPWLEGLPVPGATRDGPFPTGQTRGNPRPSPRPPGGCGGQLPRPCRPSVAMPCFMHEGDGA